MFTGDFGQVRDLIIVESSWLGSSEPVTTGQVSSFIYQMLQVRGQDEFATAYDLLPFEVVLLAPTRTLCEKTMSLVRFSYSEKPLMDLRNKIRHVYDLHQLLQQADLSTFFDSDEFALMLHKVGRDDEVSFRNNKDWLYRHPANALVFSELESVWPELRSTYHGSFKNLVFGELPADEQVFQTLKRIKERLATVAWTIGKDYS